MHQVTVYSTETCPVCKQLKDFLKSHDVIFKDHDVSKDHAKLHEMVNKSKAMGVPVVDIDGVIIRGFDEERIKEALDLED